MNPRALRVLGLFGAYLSIATIERVIDVVELQRIELDVLRADAQQLLDTLDQAASTCQFEPMQRPASVPGGFGLHAATCGCRPGDVDRLNSWLCARCGRHPEDHEDQADDVDAGLEDAIDLGDVLAAHGIDVG